MAFYCYQNVKSGESPDHKHETIAEMRAAHPATSKWEEAERPVTGAWAVPPADPALLKSPPVARVPDPVPTPTEMIPTVHSPVTAVPAAPVETVPSTPVESLWEKRQRQVQEAGAKDSVGRPFYDKRLAMVKMMLDLIPDGYYATQSDDTSTVDFLRINRPSRGKWIGHVKIQTQHSELWRNDLALMPDGIWLVQDARVIDSLMLAIADHRTCARRYAIELQSCCVCNTTLTDDRSRHYLIGPICDKKDAWTWVVEEVDDKNLGLSYEQLVARGLPTRVWQDRELKRA